MVFDEAALKGVFARFDSDGSGSIDDSELMNAMRMLGVKCTPNSAKKVLKMIDKDGNGTVEWEEFKIFFEKVGDPDQIKVLLSKNNQRFFEYKQLVEGDPSFAKTFAIPPMESQTRKFDGHSDDVLRVAWLSDTQVISGSMNGEIKIWALDAPGKYPKHQSEFSVQTDDDATAVYSMATSNEGTDTLLITGRSSTVVNMWKVPDGTFKMKFEGHSSPVFCCLFSKDNSRIVSGGKNGTLCLHDIMSQTPKHRWQGHDKVVNSVDFNRAGNLLCSASVDGTVKVFDVRNANDLMGADAIIDEAAASGTVYQALFGKEDHLIFSCGDDYCAKLWDTRKVSGDGPISSFFGHTSVVRSIELSSDASYLVTGTGSGSIRVWNASEMELIQSHKDEAQKVFADLQEQCVREEAMLDEGTGDITTLDVLATNRKKIDAEKSLAYWTHIFEEREFKGCTQAVLGLDGPISPVTTLAWRDRADNTAFVAAGAQDQSVRLFKVDPGTLEKIEPWTASDGTA